MFIGHYFCAYIDILGQKEALAKFDENRYFHTFDKASGDNDFFSDIKATRDVVLNTRKTIKDCVNVWEPEILDLNSLDKATQLKIKRDCKPNVGVVSFSDFVCFFGSLDRQKTLVPMAQIWPGICAVMFCQLNALANGASIRGGVDIGLGFEVEGDDFYGPVLSRAYQIESSLASSPRVLVGERFVKDIKSIAEIGYEGEYQNLNKTMAKNISRCLNPTADGQIELDFLGEANYEWVMGDTWDAKQMFLRAESFVSDQEMRYRRQKNSKLQIRFEALADYFSSRRSIWVNRT
jgi:hypothetical protein